MKALLLAGGKSRRMQPVKDKCLLNFLGKPLIVHQMDMLRRAGFDEIVIVGGAHNLSALKEVCEGAEFCQQGEEHGMRAAVMAAADLIKGGSVLIVSSNDVIDAKAFELVRGAVKGDADGYILGKKVEKYFPGGYLEVEGDVIKSIVEKPGAGNEPSDLVNLVVHFHRDADKLIGYLEEAESSKDDVYEVALDKMFKEGKYEVVRDEGFWQPVKFPWHIQDVFRHLFLGQVKSLPGESAQIIAGSAEISDKAVIKGNVVIGEGVKIFEGAIINGPVYLGDGCVVANNALVRDSHVGKNCVIGFGTEVARSYLGSDVWTHSNYIGDSVIGSNVSFGAGTVTGNLRLDEMNIVVECDGDKVDCGKGKFGLVCGDNVRVGINNSFMPGIKVGSNSFIGAGLTINENIPEKSFVRGETSLKISENRASADMDDRKEMKDNL